MDPTTTVVFAAEQVSIKDNKLMNPEFADIIECFIRKEYFQPGAETWGQLDHKKYPKDCYYIDMIKLLFGEVAVRSRKLFQPTAICCEYVPSGDAAILGLKLNLGISLGGATAKMLINEIVTENEKKEPINAEPSGSAELKNLDSHCYVKMIASLNLKAEIGPLAPTLKSNGLLALEGECFRINCHHFAPDEQNSRNLPKPLV